MPQTETIAFLQTKFALSNISIDEETANYLISVAADIPYYIQLLASEVWQETVNNLSVITKEMIDEGVIEKSNDVYFISDPFFRMFVSRC